MNKIFQIKIDEENKYVCEMTLSASWVWWEPVRKPNGNIISEMQG
jgi:hypothetical protein